MEKIAVVTGANKGIGLEICKKLVEINGIRVVLTARDETRGRAAMKKIDESMNKNLVFHQLDVSDSKSIDSLRDFIQSQFGRLDILINNAGVGGVEVEPHALDLAKQAPKESKREIIANALVQTYEKAKECIDINYCGTKRMCETFIPLLELSKSPKIVNLTSFYGKLQYIPNEDTKKEMRNIDELTQERLDEIVSCFLSDFRPKTLEESGWPTFLTAYKVSKIAISTYTRLLAKKYPNLCINCVHPGHVNTDLTWNIGHLPVEEGAKAPVMVALLPDNSISGQFYFQTELSSFE
ncbi:hypothetical protein LUZ60_009882 [Juncus effusus]|nr:hypothetical protein LUZ60_009882 [Juncus effusus]